MDRKAERTAKFNRNQQAKHKQKTKSKKRKYEDDFEDMQVQTKGEFGGLGIEVSMEAGYVKVVSRCEGVVMGTKCLILA